jgi:hypothetical protein
MASPQRPASEAEWRPSANLPPLTRIDLLGIAVAIVGTLALIMLAAVTADDDTATGALSAARILIAIGATLVNIAHVVGILFFESVGYHGPFQRFFAKVSLIGTPAAIVLSLALGLVL